MGDLSRAIQNAVAPVAKRLAERLGERTKVLRSIKDRRADNSARDVWAPVAGLEAVAFPIDIVSASTAQRIWGADTEATAVGENAPLGIKAGDIITPLEGALAGRYFEVIGSDPDNYTQTARLELAERRPVAEG